MRYSVAWAGVAGPARKTGLNAAEALRWYKTYSQVSALVSIEDDEGASVAVEDLKKLVESGGGVAPVAQAELDPRQVGGGR